MKKYLLAIATMLIFGSATPSNAQQVQEQEDILANLTFESYKKYVRPKKEEIKVRKTPSLQNKNTTIIPFWFLYPVLAENAGWYKTPRGWIQKKDAIVAKNQSIPSSVMNAKGLEYGDYDDPSAVWWRVYSPIGKHELAICTDGVQIWLGKLVDNVFIFKYAIWGYARNVSEGSPSNTFNVRKELDNDRLNYTIEYGSNFALSSDYSWNGFDLSKLNDKILTYLFKDVIEKGQVAETPLFINSELLLRQMEDVIFDY